MRESEQAKDRRRRRNSRDPRAESLSLELCSSGQTLPFHHSFTDTVNVPSSGERRELTKSSRTHSECLVLDQFDPCLQRQQNLPQGSCSQLRRAGDLRSIPATRRCFCRPCRAALLAACGKKRASRYLAC